MTPPVSPSLLWRLARPRGMPLVLALPAFGYGFGLWEGALPLRNPGGFCLVLAAWWFLSAGTLWLNAVLDQDEGEVLMGSGPGGAPASVGRFGHLALWIAVALASAAGATPALCAIGCAVLAVAYSDRRTAWKAHPALGPLVNLVGYGLLSPVAGFAVVGVSPTPRTGVAELLILGWVGGTYLGAQAFQQREDSARGYRTLVVTHGPRVVLQLARALYGLAIGGLILGGIGGLFPRAVISVIGPWWLLDSHLAGWASDPGRGISAAREMLRRATFLAAWVMAAATADHLLRMSQGLPVAGQGTAWQPDR